MFWLGEMLSWINFTTFFRIFSLFAPAPESMFDFNEVD